MTTFTAETRRAQDMSTDANLCPCCKLTVAECMAGGVNLTAVIEASAAAWDCAAKDILAPTRTPNHVSARRLAMALYRELTGYKVCFIAHAFSVNHGTVSHALGIMRGLDEGGRERRVYGALLAKFRKETL